MDDVSEILDTVPPVVLQFIYGNEKIRRAQWETVSKMASSNSDDISNAIEELYEEVRFARLLTICGTFFGEPRINGSHHIFKVPWQGDPRINLQAVKGGKAKPYQVEQVSRALARLALEQK